jgi:hypothetical protein
MKTLAIAGLSGLIAACATSWRAPVVDQTARTSEVVNQNYLKRGYQAVHRNGQLLYCRSETVSGTRFLSTVCETDAQLKAAEQTRQYGVDELRKSRSGVCTALKCN